MSSELDVVVKFFRRMGNLLKNNIIVDWFDEEGGGWYIMIIFKFVDKWLRDSLIYLNDLNFFFVVE